MKRQFGIPVVVAIALVTAAVHADVKTKEKTQIRFGGGILGSLMNRAAGDSAKEGVINTVAVKGNRKSMIGDATGQIVDMTEEKIYELDLKKKEFKVTTFAEMRERIRDAREKAAKQAKEMPAEDKEAAQEAAKQFELEIDVKETGQTRQIAGHNAREVVLTISAHEKDKKLEESGGFVMKNDMWLGPRIAALDEIAAFDQRYYKALWGDSFAIDPQQMATLMAMFPSMSKMSARMQAESAKMQGTALLTATTFETVKSAEQLKTSGENANSSGGGGGIGGMLASRMMKRGPVEARTTMMTTTVERLSVETSAAADDVAVPAGFKEKK